MIKLIDSHCHLVSEKLKENVPLILQRAHQAHVDKIINIAYDLDTVFLALEQEKTSPMLLTALGIQPHDAHSFSVEIGEKIKELARNNRKVVAIGEIGLDGHHALSPMEKQQECFDYFLQCALDMNLPVIIHVREAHQEVYSKLSHYAKLGLQGVIHCFTGTCQEAKQFLDCGFYISFSGIVTFKNAREVQQAAQMIPSDKILIETDSPYLSPTPLRGLINEPSHLIHTCQFIANLRNQSLEEFAQTTYRNTATLFNLVES